MCNTLTILVIGSVMMTLVPDGIMYVTANISEGILFKQ